MLKHLKFLKKIDLIMRKEIYRYAEMVEIPSQKRIYNMGDEGDYGYIILKGRVTEEKRNP